jgi:hypothetical protein
MGITKAALMSGMLSGGLVLGGLVTYNGGAIVQKAQLQQSRNKLQH